MATAEGLVNLGRSNAKKRVRNDEPVKNLFSQRRLGKLDNYLSMYMQIVQTT